MQFNKYASLLIALITGIASMSDHEYSLLIAIIGVFIAWLWANGVFFKEE